MQILMLMRSSKVKRSGTSSKSENLPVAPQTTCQIMDSFILTFVKHGNVRKDNFDCFDMHVRPFNAYIT